MPKISFYSHFFSLILANLLSYLSDYYPNNAIQQCKMNKTLNNSSKCLCYVQHFNFLEISAVYQFLWGETKQFIFSKTAQLFCCNCAQTLKRECQKMKFCLFICMSVSLRAPGRAWTFMQSHCLFLIDISSLPARQSVDSYV